jgi:hypothetical protein
LKKLNEDKLEPIIIDLTNGNNLNESWYRMFGTWIKLFLGHMFNLNRYNFKVKGTRKQLDSFAKTLKAEKRYMDAFKKAGLNNPRTIKNKSLLNKAVSKFEKATGIKWPLK